MELIKNSKHIKLPRSTGSVQGTLRRAKNIAQERGWTKIIIIGNGSNHRGCFHSIMSDEVKFGMIEIAKAMLLEDL